MTSPDPAPELEFDLEGLDPKPRPVVEQTTAAPQQSGLFARIAHTLDRLKARGGIIGTVASFAIVAAKFLGVFKLVLLLLVKIPLLVTFGTMALSIWLEALSFGWPMAIGIVVMIFIHECGHAWAARRLGRPAKAMIFVPFMGAVVFTKGGGTTVTQDAFVGIMGPVFGTAVGVIYVTLFLLTRLPVFLNLAVWTFGINLFNLLPTPPLDGGWIVPVISPKFMAFGMVLLLGAAFYNPLIIVLAIMSLPRVIAAWKATPANATYFRATPRDRMLYGSLYIGLAVLLFFAQHFASLGLIAVSPHQIL